MFWTLVLMTQGGTPIPTDLVYDSIDECYEAEEVMAIEGSRYNNESVATGSANRETLALRRDGLKRGICIPHSVTRKTDNLPNWMTTSNPDRLYRFFDLARPASDPAVQDPPIRVFIAPQFDYKLPKSRLAFRLILQNHTDKAISVRNPLQSLYLSFQRPDGPQIDLPMNVPESLVQRMDPLTNRPLLGPSNVEFRTATLNGRKDPVARDTYSIEPKASLEIVFEGERAAGERILAALKDRTARKFVYVSAALNLLHPDGAGDVFIRLGEKIRLPVPTP